MEYGYFRIEIRNEETDDLYDYVSDLEVELDVDLASTFRIRLAILEEQTGLWEYLDDGRLKVWNEITIIAGPESSAEELIHGYITHVRPYFDPDPAQSFLEIWGTDKSVLMDREEKLKSWIAEKDSEIAADIFRSHKFATDKNTLEDTRLVHEEAVSTIIQRETDLQFLRRLARRNGFECYVERVKGKPMGFFRKPQLDAEPQPALIVLSEEETNVIHFSAEINALEPTNVTMTQVDRINKEAPSRTADSSQQTILGRTDAVLATGMRPGHVHIGKNVATGVPEMESLVQHHYHQRQWFVTGEGLVSGNYYEHVLKPRRTVTIRGVGETFSGVYYVTHVTHTFDATGEDYTQFFRVKRNAIRPTGD